MRETDYGTDFYGCAGEVVHGKGDVVGFYAG